MNENLNLVEILKDCPKGTKLYSTVYGWVEFIGISTGEFPVKYLKDDESLGSATAQGLLLSYYDGECTLFPSKEQRDWSKFAAPWAELHPANVWHEAKDKPRTKEWILAQFSEDDYEAFALDDLGVETWLDWWCKNYKVRRWAYIRDLMPKGGEQ